MGCINNQKKCTYNDKGKTNQRLQKSWEIQFPNLRIHDLFLIFFVRKNLRKINLFALFTKTKKTNITEPFFSNDNAWFWAHLSCVFLAASGRPHFLWKIRTGISKFQRMSTSSNWLYVRGQAAHVLLWCNDFHLHDGLLKWHVTDCDRKGGGLNALEGSRNWFLSDHSEPSTSSTFLSCFPSGH